MLDLPTIEPWLVPWLGTVGIGGILLNSLILLRASKWGAPRPGPVVRAVVYGFAVQHIVGWPVYVAILAGFDVPREAHETLSYFVNTFLLAFVSVPLGIAGYRFHTLRRG